MNEHTCNRCNKRLTTSQKKFCSHACANRTTMERKRQASLMTPWKPCEVDGCGKPGRSRTAGICPMHYHRQYRYGTLARTGELRKRGVLPRLGHALAGRRYGTLVVDSHDGTKWVCHCDCGGTRRASTGELNREGDANTCGIPGRHLTDHAEYGAAHSRVHRSRGKADQYPYVDCGGQSRHWSYNHDDPDERISQVPRTAGTAYSLNPQHYAPRCVSCHKLFDLGRPNATNLTRSGALD